MRGLRERELDTHSQGVVSTHACVFLTTLETRHIDFHNASCHVEYEVTHPGTFLIRPNQILPVHAILLFILGTPRKYGAPPYSSPE